MSCPHRPDASRPVSQERKSSSTRLLDQVLNSVQEGDERTLRTIHQQAENVARS